MSEVIDLRNCEEGDILISKHGAKLKYISPAEKENYYDHVVEYIAGSPLQDEAMTGRGTRTHSGHVMRQNRLESDHDIVMVIKNK